MNLKTLSVFVMVWSAFASAMVAEDRPTPALEISISETSIKLGEIELRSGPSRGKYRFLWLAAGKKALGPVAEKYSAGRVVVYAWPAVGVQIQEGIRGSESGKMFKFQVYLEDDFDSRSEKHSGKVPGPVRVEGLEMGPSTTFGSLRDELQKKGYKITEEPDLTYASKSGAWGQIQIFSVGSSGKIGRVEVWCL